MPLQVMASGAFQSTLPARGATSFFVAFSGKISNFNPRSPHGERLLTFQTRPPLAPISIHAPRTGSDIKIIPRDPVFAVQFQSTLPARGATGRQEWAYFRRNDFNPRSPHGERRNKQRCAISICLFQSTLPARGATDIVDILEQRMEISIHAPRTGSDYVRRETIELVEFQSTLPARGATIC